MQLDWEGRTPKKESPSKVGYYYVIAIFLLLVSCWLLAIGGGFKSVILVVATYIYCLWSDATRKVLSSCDRRYFRTSLDKTC